MADRKISDLTALTTPATGDLIPIVDVSEAAAADKNKSITVGELLRGAPDGTAAAPGIAFESDGGNGIFLAGTDQVGVATAGTERVEFGPSEVVFNDGGNDYNFRVEGDTDTALFFVDASTDRIGVGTVSPSGLLHLAGSAASLYFEDTSSSNTLSRIFKSGSALTFNSRHTSAGQFVFNSEDSSGTVSERARIDQSGRLLLGASSSSGAANSLLQVRDEGGAQVEIIRSTSNASPSRIRLTKSRGSEASPTAVSNDDIIGEIRFHGHNGTNYSEYAASIQGVVDGTPGTGDMPGRLVFATTAESAASPTERMRIDSSGNVGIGGTANVTNGGYNGATLHLYQTGSSSAGSQIRMTNGGTGHATSDGLSFSYWSDSNCYFFNKEDGDIIFGVNNVEEVRVLSGGGITFNGDTAAANALDDYEEGTWTASLFDAETGGNQSSSTITGHYTKVGNICTFRFSLIDLDTTGLTGTNAAYFNLPFPSSGNWGAPVASTLLREVNWSGSQTAVTSYLNSSSSRFRLFVQGDNVGYAAINVNEISDGAADLYFSGTYRTA